MLPLAQAQIFAGSSGRYDLAEPRALQRTVKGAQLVGHYLGASSTRRARPSSPVRPGNRPLSSTRRPPPFAFAGNAYPQGGFRRPATIDTLSEFCAENSVDAFAC